MQCNKMLQQRAGLYWVDIGFQIEQKIIVLNENKKKPLKKREKNQPIKYVYHREVEKTLSFFGVC